MELVFVCPQTRRVFHSRAYTVIDNQGVKTAADGTRTLDARVRLDHPCPFCGERHVYPAHELSCPLRGPENDHGSR